MDFEAELYEKFHNLPGSIVAEKKKSLNAFIRELNDKIPQESIKNTFVKNLTPKNKLETVFRVDLLLHYQIYDAVLDLLKSGNLLYISMILKDWNFFKKTFQNMSGSTFVNEVLSHTSFSTRMKVINRVAKNLSSQEKADEFLEAIEGRYGISSADVMLTFCSLPVIKAKVEKYNLQLKYRQLMTIAKRYSEFLEFYFGRFLVSDSDSESDCNSVVFHLDLQEETKMVKAIYKQNEELFRKLCEKYSINVNFGKHLSKKVLRDKEYLFNDLKNCSIKFQRRQVYQQLRKNPEMFKRFVLDRTSDDITEFCADYTTPNTEIGYLIYRNISESKRYQFLNGFFKEKFGVDLHERPELITEKILRVMPDKFRENILDAKIKENAKLVYLYRPDTSVPFIMDKIKHCSDRKKRVSYVSMLCRTCQFHKNEVHLLDILKYVETRHRNDTNALQKLMDGLASWKNIENLSVKHWTYIDRIQKLLKLKDMAVSEQFFLEKHIVHLLNNNLNAREQLQNYCEFLRRNEYVNSFFVDEPKYRRLFILEMKKYTEKIEDENEKYSLFARYLKWVYQYNTSTTSKDDISILEHLPLVHTFLKKDRLSDVKNIITFYVRLYYKQFNPIVWEHRQHLFDDTVSKRNKQKALFSWYLLHHEDELLNNIELIFELQAVKENQKFIRYLSLYSFRNIPERLTNLSVKTIQTEECISRKIIALNVLALLNQEEFLGVAELFDPDAGGKIDADAPPDRIKLQEGFLKSLQHLDPSAELLKILTKFCVGDYLKYALKPFYSTISRIPEESAVSFLKKLHKSAVSVRKHTIHLGRFIFPLDDYLNFIIRESVSEKNASLKNILFQKALEYAKIMPTSRIWELIKATMHGIDKDDVEAHDLLLKINQVPKQYRAAYIPEAYSKLDTSLVSDIRKKKFDFIKNIPAGVIDQLDRNLLQTFITEVIFHDNWSVCCCWTNFVFHSTGDKQNVLFDFALSQLEEHNIQQPSDVIDDKQSSFMDNLCEAILKFRPSYSTVKKFASSWLSKFPPEIEIDRHFYVTFVATYAQCRYDIKSFATETQELLGTYSDCLELFVECLKHFLKQIDSLDVCEFVESFLTVRDTIPACLLSIRVLSLRDPKNKEEAARYSSVIQKLRERSELSVKIYYRKYLYDFEEDVNKKL